MLVEIEITDFAIADQLRVGFAPGLNVLTGETGAGKSIVADALALLLGGRGDVDWVRAGAASARIEGVFDITTSPRAGEELERSGITTESDLVLTREIAVGGRGSARINTRPVPLSALANVGRLLADIHGQNDYLSLFRAVEQLRYLNRFAGTLDLAAEVHGMAAEVRRARAEAAALQGDERERARQLDRIAFEAAEIDAARLEAGEDDELRGERDRLANAEQLASASDEAYQHLSGREGISAADTLAEAARLLASASAYDPDLAAMIATLEGAAEQVQDVAREVRTYRDGIEFSPGRLAEIEQRLDLIANLKRKYGATVDDVLAYGVGLAVEAERLGGATDLLEAMEHQAAARLGALGDACGRLSLRRRDGAARLSAAVEAELRELGMPHARFAVRFVCETTVGGVTAPGAAQQVIGEGEWEAPTDDGPWGFDSSGIDRVEFVVSMNAGEPLRPLAKVASGGETARMILALKSIVGAGDETSILVFDEVDTGLGGRSGGIIGEKLARLAAHHQVICITHLPQIACFADRHIGVSKLQAGVRTTVGAMALEGEARETELAAMLGHVTDATRASAFELLEGARAYKTGQVAAGRTA